jgi:hypothetical protein
MALLGAGDRALSSLQARMTLPTGGAQWIWEEHDRSDHNPSAFLAVRDFELESVPSHARLLSLGDPEYVLELNGHEVASGRWRPDLPLDVRDVTDLLQVGGNRLIARLRSDHGTGGFLAVIQDDSGHNLVGTDGSWRIVRKESLGLVRGWLPLAPDAVGSVESEPPLCWGLPPVGRWGKPRIGAPRPTFVALTRGARPLPPANGPFRLSSRPGAPVLWDWGREVSGYLSLKMPPGGSLGMGLVFLGDAPPEPRRDRPSGSILVVPGERSWIDARPRRFRYALVVGMERPLTVSVLPVDPRKAGDLLAQDGVEKGVFGIDPPPLRTPVEDEVWRKLQRVPGVGGRKSL